MRISIEEFEKGIKQLEKGSLTYDILQLLKVAKKTIKPACDEEDILKALNITPPKFQGKLDFLGNLDYYDKVSKVRFALRKLEFKNKIVSKEIKIEGKIECVTFYMAK